MTQPVASGDAHNGYLRAREAPVELQRAQEQLRVTGERRYQAELDLTDLYDRLEHITGWNLATWWPRLTGRIRARQEALVDEIVRQTPNTQRAVAEHESAIIQMRQAQARADDLPSARDAAVAELTGPTAAEAQQVLAETNRIRHALAAAGRAQSLAASITESLDSAGRWSMYDTYFGGQLGASALKHEHIHSANDASAALTDELALLRTELQAMRAPTAYFSVQTNDFFASSDLWGEVWNNNLISDLAVARRISGSQDRLRRLDAGLRDLVTVLGQRLQEAVARLDALLASDSASTRPAPGLN